MKKNLLFLLSTIMCYTLLLNANPSFEFVVINSTCRQMEVRCISGGKQSLSTYLFPYSKKGFSVNENQPVTIQWRRIFGSLRSGHTGNRKFGDHYAAYTDPQQAPFRTEGSLEILSDEGHFRQLLTITDKNKTQKLLPSAPEN